jgi:hypothetical protein
LVALERFEATRCWRSGDLPAPGGLIIVKALVRSPLFLFIITLVVAFAAAAIQQGIGAWLRLGWDSTKFWQDAIQNGIIVGLLAYLTNRVQKYQDAIQKQQEELQKELQLLRAQSRYVLGRGDTIARDTGSQSSLSFPQAPNPGERVPCLGSAKPIACDATAGSDLDAVAGSRTMDRREDDTAQHDTMSVGQ